jgi:PAS domain S-box-containing protein
LINKENKEKQDGQRKINSEFDLAEIIQFLPEATFIVDMYRKVILWNKAMEELTNLKAEEILGKDSRDYSIPLYGEIRPFLVDLILNPQKDIEAKYPFFERKGETLIAEVFIPRFKRDGAYLWAKARPLYNHNGDIIGVIETIRDITPYKRAEEDLKKSQQRLSERVKELNCLYEIIKLINHPIISVDDILQGTVELIPSAWQFPEHICSRIIFGKHEYKTSNFQETPWGISNQNLVRDIKLIIKVNYLKEEAFLEEEVVLLGKITNQLKSLLEFKLDRIM